MSLGCTYHFRQSLNQKSASTKPKNLRSSSAVWIILLKSIYHGRVLIISGISQNFKNMYGDPWWPDLAWHDKHELRRLYKMLLVMKNFCLWVISNETFHDSLSVYGWTSCQVSSKLVVRFQRYSVPWYTGTFIHYLKCEGHSFIIIRIHFGCKTWILFQYSWVKS